MKKLFVIVISLFAGTHLLSAQKGEAFPDLSGKTMDGKSVSLPEDTKGKFTLVAIAQSVQAQAALESWLTPVQESLVDNPFFPVRLFFVPLLGNGMKEKVEQKMRDGLDESYFPYILIPDSEPEGIAKTLNMKDKSLPYFFVISPEGEITYITSGTYSEAKLEAITDALSE
ncbi:MAG: hypothetical protein M3Q97_02100 [Bacteroidota bacterium]|nr:hypothetical protein [Bacteroidota bacterium]